MLARVGVICQLQGDESRAESLLRESVALMRERGQRAKVYIALAGLSGRGGSQGKLIQALGHMREALLIGQEIGHRSIIGPSIALGLIGCASCLAGLGMLEQAAQIGGAAEALLERMDATLRIIYYRRYMSKLEGLKNQATETKWAGWWAEGTCLSQQQEI